MTGGIIPTGNEAAGVGARLYVESDLAHNFNVPCSQPVRKVWKD